MISDDALQEAARTFQDALLASLPEPEDCPAQFSPAFERKMKKLILRVDHPFRFWLVRAALPLALARGLAGGVPAAAGPGRGPVPPPIHGCGPAQRGPHGGALRRTRADGRSGLPPHLDAQGV